MVWHFRFARLARHSSCHSRHAGREALNERILQPEEQPLDAYPVFAASGCAYAAQPSLEREPSWTGQPKPLSTGPRNTQAKDGNSFIARWRRSFRGRTDWEGHAGQHAWMAAKYFVRAMSLPLEHSRFLAFLDSHPLLRACVMRQPGLQERHLHRFVNRRWHRIDRLHALQAHYRLLLQRWPEALFEAVYVKGSAALGNIALRDGRQLGLHLLPAAHKGLEGELTIALNDDDGEALYHLTLTLIDDDTLAIGCIQGPRGGAARERVRELTRDMYGMRPKQLLLVLAYAFAGQLGLSRVVAVGNAAHPLAGGRRIFSDYDGFWLEQGGEQVPAGWFLLPETPHHRTEQEQQSKRRALFRRRADLRWAAVRLLNDAVREGAWWGEQDVRPGAIESSVVSGRVSRAA